MKAADMVLQAELVSRWAADKRLAFVGDGDAISVAVSHMRALGIVAAGPTSVTVLDFDERIVRAIRQFASAKQIEGLDAILYNAIDALPDLGLFDCFYTNPPWGASNMGQSVKLFIERGVELVGRGGEGLVVLADHHASFSWTGPVLAEVQRFILDRGYFITSMMQGRHEYHLDDSPELKSCNVLFRSEREPLAVVSSRVDDPARLINFYGRGAPPTARYIRAGDVTDYGKAHPAEYSIDKWEEP